MCGALVRIRKFSLSISLCVCVLCVSLQDLEVRNEFVTSGPLGGPRELVVRSQAHLAICEIYFRHYYFFLLLSLSFPVLFCFFIVFLLSVF